MSSPATVQERGPSRLARIARALRAPVRLALDVALPPLCPACREVVGESAGLCASCWSKLCPIERPFCERLGIPFVYDPGPGVLSMQAIADPPAYARARAAVRYDDVARALVHAFKYGDRLDLAPTMGAWMARAGQELLAEADAIVPVPLHWRRIWARRFNQSAALSKVISERSGIPVAFEALKRVKATPQQVGLSKSERALNMQGAFRVAPGRKAEIPGPGSCSWTTCSPREPPPIAAPGRCCGRARVRSICSRLHGLWTPRARPYSGTAI